MRRAPTRAGQGQAQDQGRVTSLESYEVLEVIYNGKAVRSVKPTGGHFEAAIDGTIEVEHTSPIYLEMSGRPAPAAESADRANFPTLENRQETLDLIAKAEAIYKKLDANR